MQPTSFFMDFTCVSLSTQRLSTVACQKPNSNLKRLPLQNRSAGLQGFYSKFSLTFSIFPEVSKGLNHSLMDGLNRLGYLSEVEGRDNVVELVHLIKHVSA